MSRYYKPIPVKAHRLFWKSPAILSTLILGVAIAIATLWNEYITQPVIHIRADDNSDSAAHYTLQRQLHCQMSSQHYKSGDTAIAMPFASKSKCFEMPEHDRELIDQYEKNISEELTEEQQQQLAQIDEEIDLAEREINYKITLEEHRQKFITEGNPRLKNWQMAQADFQIDWLQKEKQQFQQQCYLTIEQRLFKLKADLNELPNKFQPPASIYSPEQIKVLKDKWLKEQAGKLEADWAQDIKARGENVTRLDFRQLVKALC